MAKSIKALMLVGLVAFVAACAQQEEEVVFEPVEPEPVLNKF
ncbi:hypothetical protein [Actibacterium sp. 188UL27-1]|nr:hypothetical protein [Actibacterium sp. 188UL27-1]